MAKFFNSLLNINKKGVIGIDYSDSAMHAVQFQKSNDQITVHKSASVTYPEGISVENAFENIAECQELFKSKIKQEGFIGHKIVTALPEHLYKSHFIEYELSNPEQEGNIILEKIKDRVEGDVSDYLIDFIPVRDESSEINRHALVAVAKYSDIQQFIDFNNALGFKIISLEIAPVAIRRLFNFVTDNSNTLILNCSTNDSYITLISGKRLIFSKKINLGKNYLVRHLSQELELSPEHIIYTLEHNGLKPEKNYNHEKNQIIECFNNILKVEFSNLANEIMRCILYSDSITKGNSVEKIYLLGSLAKWNGANILLGNYCEVEVEIVDLEKIFNDSSASNKTALGVEFTIASGLGLFGFEMFPFARYFGIPLMRNT